MITVVYLSLLHDNMNSIPIIKVAPRWQEKHRRQVPKANTVSPSQTTSPINAAAQLQLKLLASNYPLWRAQFVTFLRGYDGSRRDSSAMINKESEILSNLEHKIWKQYDRLFLYTVTCLCFEVRLMKLGLVLVDFMPTSQVDIFENCKKNWLLKISKIFCQRFWSKIFKNNFYERKIALNDFKSTFHRSIFLILYIS